MTERQILTLVVFFWLFVAFRFLLRQWEKHRIKRKQEEQQEQLKRQRTNNDVRSAAEVLHGRLNAAYSLRIRGTDWEAQQNSIIARNVLQEDMEQFGEAVKYGNVTQEMRDRMLIHARQDAAHALLNTASIMEYIHQRRTSRDELNTWLFWGLLLLGAVVWWKAGFPYIEWIAGPK